MAERSVGGGEGVSRAGSILVAAAALALGAGATWYLGRAQAAARLERPTAGALLPLDPFVANLADDGGKRYLKAALQVELFEARVPAELETGLPQVRDLLLTLLSSKRFAEIATPQGKAQLRGEIVARVNRALGRDLVRAVYFTEFIVQ